MDLWKECILQHSWYYTVLSMDKESRKTIDITYYNEIISWNYSSRSSKYSFTIAIITKTKLQLRWYHNDINTSFCVSVLLLQIFCSAVSHVMTEMIYWVGSFTISLVLIWFYWIPHHQIIKLEISVSSLMYNSASTTNIYTFYPNVDIQSHAFILLSFHLPSHLTKWEKKTLYVI